MVPSLGAPLTEPDTMEAPRVQEQRPDMDDIALLRRVAAGDAAAFKKLVDRHAQRLYRLAVSMVGNAADAEDVLQESFAGAFEGAGRFQGRASVKTWLTRILILQVAKWRRSQRRRSEPLDPMRPPMVADGATRLASRIDIQAAMQMLSPEHREVLALREFEQMSYEEMAQILDVPRGTIESRLHRARAELRERLKAYS
jgi:RNA polymerase sigma-70 factor (ECF subfamily)